MKQIKVYIRIAKNPNRGYKVAISTKPNPESLHKSGYYSDNFALPTIRFGVKINIPEDAFDFNRTIENEIQLNVSNKEVK